MDRHVILCLLSKLLVTGLQLHANCFKQHVLQLVATDSWRVFYWFVLSVLCLIQLTSEVTWGAVHHSSSSSSKLAGGGGGGVNRQIKPCQAHLQLWKVGINVTVFGLIKSLIVLSLWMQNSLTFKGTSGTFWIVDIQISTSSEHFEDFSSMAKSLMFKSVWKLGLVVHSWPPKQQLAKQNHSVAVLELSVVSHSLSLFSSALSGLVVHRLLQSLHRNTQ